MDEIKTLLSEKDIPQRWYNVQADLPAPLAPPIHPVTHKPIGPDDLALFDENCHWTVEPGEFDVTVGGLKKQLTVKLPASPWRRLPEQERPSGLPLVDCLSSRARTPEASDPARQ